MLLQIGLNGGWGSFATYGASTFDIAGGIFYIYAAILGISAFTGGLSKVSGLGFGGFGDKFKKWGGKGLNKLGDIFNKKKKDEDKELDITDKEIPEIENEENMEKRLAGLQTRELKTEMQCIEYLKELKSIIDYVQKNPAEIGKYIPEIKSLFQRIKEEESLLMKFDIYSEKMMKKLWKLEQIEEKQTKVAEKLSEDERKNHDKVAHEFVTGEKLAEKEEEYSTIIVPKELKGIESVYAAANKIEHKSDYLNQEKLKLIKENLKILRNKDKILKALQINFNNNIKAHKILMQKFNELESDLSKGRYGPAMTFIDEMIKLLGYTIKNGRMIENELGTLLRDDNILIKSWNKIHEELKEEEKENKIESKLVGRLKLEEKKQERLLEKDKKEIKQLVKV